MSLEVITPLYAQYLYLLAINLYLYFISILMYRYQLCSHEHPLDVAS